MISRKAAEIGMATVTALFGAVISYGATEFGVGWAPSGPEPGTFPFYIGLIVALASLGNIAMALIAGGNAPLLERSHVKDILRFVVPVIGFVILSLLLGIYVATFFYMLGTMIVQGRYGWGHALAVSVGLPLGLFLLMEKAFKVPLLKGPLEALIGL